MARPRNTREGLRRLVEDWAGGRVGEAWELTIARAAAYVLSLGWPRQAVTRATLRAAMPADDNVDDKLIHALRYFEHQEWVTVGRVAVFIHKPEALYEYSVRGYTSQALILRDFVNIRQSLVAIDAATGGSDGERALRFQEREYLASLA
jgi:hypothetical protein